MLDLVHVLKPSPSMLYTAAWPAIGQNEGNAARTKYTTRYLRLMMRPQFPGTEAERKLNVLPL